MPENSRLLKVQGALYLDLKTQAFISAMSQGERSRSEILEDLFPSELEEDILRQRHGSARVLSPSEVDFIARCKSRKEIVCCRDKHIVYRLLQANSLGF